MMVRDVARTRWCAMWRLTDLQALIFLALVIIIVSVLVLA